jgi:hypothetical protein
MASDIDCVDDVEEIDAQEQYAQEHDSEHLDSGENDSENFGGFSLLEVDRAGRADLMFEDNQVKAASERVKKSGVLELLAKWEAQDHPDFRQGGRPRIITAHAILVGLILLE